MSVGLAARRNDARYTPLIIACPDGLGKYLIFSDFPGFLFIQTPGAC